MEYKKSRDDDMLWTDNATYVEEREKRHLSYTIKHYVVPVEEVNITTTRARKKTGRKGIKKFSEHTTVYRETSR